MARSTPNAWTSASRGMTPFIVGLVVRDLARAQQELTAALGFAWGDVVQSDAVGWPLKVTYARTSEPYLQLIESCPDSPWEALGDGRLDHIDVWAADFEVDSRRLEAAGFSLEIESAVTGRVWRLYRAKHSRLRVEMHYPNERAAAMRRSTFGLPDPGASPVGPTYRGVGILVSKLEPAIEELQDGLSLTFADPIEILVDGQPARMTRSLEHPYLALTEHQRGSSPGNGVLGLDHLVYRLGSHEAQSLRTAGLQAGASWQVGDEASPCYRSRWCGTGLMLEA
ncbi:MAG TPA: VOC family protein [Solirubrobacteraceae bacterium]